MSKRKAKKKGPAFEPSKKQNNMNRLATFSMWEVLPYVVKNSECVGAERGYAGQMVKMWSIRYRTFQKSLSCCECGIQGVFFALECHRSAIQYDNVRYHLNLYAVDDYGEEVLMTKDHIIPKAHGGPDCPSNTRTLCKVCNEKRGAGKASNFLVFSGWDKRIVPVFGAHQIVCSGDDYREVRNEFFKAHGSPDMRGPKEKGDGESRDWEWYQIFHVPTLTIVERFGSFV